MLLLAVFLFHESYSLAQFTAFGFIWLGIAVFTYGTLGAVWKRRRDLSNTTTTPLRPFLEMNCLNGVVASEQDSEK